MKLYLTATCQQKQKEKHILSNSSQAQDMNSFSREAIEHQMDDQQKLCLSVSSVKKGTKFSFWKMNAEQCYCFMVKYNFKLAW